MAGQDVMRGNEVIVFAMRQRADDGVLVGAGGEARQMFADLHAGPLSGGDRLELAADLGGCVGLEVEHVDVARRAGEEDEDHRLRLPRRFRRGRSGVWGAMRQADAQQARVADLQRFAAGDADAMAREAEGVNVMVAFLSGRRDDRRR